MALMIPNLIKGKSHLKLTTKWYLHFAVIILLVFVCGCGKRDSKDELRQITVAQFGDFFLYAPLYVAIDAGFMQEQGLRVNLVNTGGDETTWAAVIGRRASFGVADPTFIAVAGERGRPGIIVSSLVESVPFWGITFNENIPSIDSKPLREILNNRTVATFPSPSTAYTLQRNLSTSLGIDVNIREGSPGNLIPLLHAQRADIALELEPNVSIAISEGARVLYSLAGQYPDFVITGITTTPEIVQNEPQLVEKFVCAIQFALDYIRVEPEKSINILTSRFPISPEVAKNALDRVVAEGIIPEIPTVRLPAWEAAINLRLEVGDLNRMAKWADYVNNSFADRAKLDCRISN